MPNYRRNYVPGGTYFFTLVTFHRRKCFDTPEKLDYLLSIIKQVQRSKPFDLVAYCLLPDHIHLLVTLPEAESDYSIRIREIKRLTTLRMKHKLEGDVDRIWQDKYWEHTIRDEKDLKVHFDYIHYNPVKHGLMETFDGWKWSSFGSYFDEGEDWLRMIDLVQIKEQIGGFGE